MSELAEKLMTAESQLAVVHDMLRLREDTGVDPELVAGLVSILGNVLAVVKEAVDRETLRKS